MSEETPPQAKGTCFVVMGFGRKTDFESGRTLDLDKTYRNIIKPAVIAAGLECIRADEITHSGPIDVPMYEQLLSADVVVADLSTSNKNAFYELGVRHALQPYTTIIICEDGIKSFPFDVNHVAIRQYHHMGEGIDFDEVERFRRVLTEAIIEIFNKKPRPKDSPVYTFLHNLTPPRLAEAMQNVAEAVAKSAPGAGEALVGAANQGGAATHGELMQEVDDAQKNGDFETAKSLLKLIRKRMKPQNPDAPEDPYIIQRLALVTYKGAEQEAKDIRKRKTQLTPEDEREIKEIQRKGYEEARELLKTLNPATSNDTETLGLWGAVHKRLWEITEDAQHLDEAVRGYERGFYLRNDYYNGINLAFLLNVRASVECRRDEATTARASAISCFVQAIKVRREVLSICETVLNTEKLTDDQKYWVLATMAEAYLGMGDEDAAQQKLQEAFSIAPAQWMKDSTQEQMDKLRELLADSPLKYVKTDAV
jgi:tetratricopeptide (TPR) repeat protein